MDSINSNVPDFDSSELKELKEKLVDGCHILDREGITDGFGHVSVRIPGTEAFLTLGACLSNRHFFIDVAEELCFL
jgi:hypothetical protein